jgi:predicted glutamine amidotransferase
VWFSERWHILCGLSGYSGIKSLEARHKLVEALGYGIDLRGGDSCGYVSIANGGLRYARKSGIWSDARSRFVKGASSGDTCMMHARFATCGDKKAPTNAHPFAIRRKGKVVLWGAHNGMIPDAWDCAKFHGRDITVDSQEVFELLADKQYKVIQKLDGYGVITWVEANDINHINVARLTDNSEFKVYEVAGGGIIWGSTWTIIATALKYAGLEATAEYKLDEIGRVYQIHADNVISTDIDGVKLSIPKWKQPGYSYNSSNSGWSGHSSSHHSSSSSHSPHYTSSGSSPNYGGGAYAHLVRGNDTAKPNVVPNWARDKDDDDEKAKIQKKNHEAYIKELKETEEKDFKDEFDIDALDPEMRVALTEWNGGKGGISTIAEDAEEDEEIKKQAGTWKGGRFN